MGRKWSLRLTSQHCAQTTELLLLQDSCQDSWKWQIKTRYCLVDEKVVKSKDFQHKFKVDPEGSKSQTLPRSRSRSNSSSSSLITLPRTYMVLLLKEIFKNLFRSKWHWQLNRLWQWILLGSTTCPCPYPLSIWQPNLLKLHRSRRCWDYKWYNQF